MLLHWLFFFIKMQRSECFYSSLLIAEVGGAGGWLQGSMTPSPCLVGLRDFLLMLLFSSYLRKNSLCDLLMVWYWKRIKSWPYPTQDCLPCIYYVLGNKITRKNITKQAGAEPELKKVGSMGSMLPEHPRFAWGTQKASSYLKNVQIAF